MKTCPIETDLYNKFPFLSETSLSFKVSEEREEVKRTTHYAYPNMTYEIGEISKFQLAIQKGDFTDSEIIVLLGENGTGKTTFIR